MIKIQYNENSEDRQHDKFYFDVPTLFLRFASGFFIMLSIFGVFVVLYFIKILSGPVISEQ